ncbi:MAG: hypothetical protein ACKVHR_13800 [Pirellulales bacterium]|jgi:hypothetical protein
MSLIYKDQLEKILFGPLKGVNANALKKVEQELDALELAEARVSALKKVTEELGED